MLNKEPAEKLKNLLRLAARGAGGRPPQWFVSRWVFLRLLGAIYLTAFASLWLQLDGLYGKNGISPIADFLAAVRRQDITNIFWRLPSLFWWNASDAALHCACAAGVLIAIALIAGVLQWVCLPALFLLYLSFVACGQEFLSFQWDTLLLETGFIAIFLAPLRLFSSPRSDPPPSRAIVWLHHWLLFRLMFSSGAIKIISRDETWRNLTALNYHYMTQPLPPWTAWYLHQLPPWFQSLSTLLMFFIELLVPFCIFLPRPFRLAGAALLILLQVLIIVTGNYCFFNYLTIALCLLLLDDRAWPTRLRNHFPDELAVFPGRFRKFAGRPLRAAVVILILALSVPQQLLTLRWIFPRENVFWNEYYRLTLIPRSWLLVNGYGLFANMTTTRPEIVFEGSDDGREWKSYEFKFKPGALDRRPRFVAPYQPRLDWQLWFAALRAPGRRPWVNSFMLKLLEGQPEVLSLLADNPFPDRPPRYVRALLYDYDFTDFESGKNGEWWQRTLIGTYQRPTQLSDFNRGR